MGSNWCTVMNYRCAICDTRIYHPKRYFCWHCYNDFRDEIREKKEWTTFVVSEESKRRSREKRDAPVLIYLGDEWDISIGGTLIHKGYRYGQKKKRARSSGENREILRRV